MGFTDDPLYLQILQVTATISTISLFLCGIPICLEIRRRKNTDEITSLPFLMGFIGSSFWLRYGMLVSEIAMIAVNIAGSFLMFCYLVFYVCYTKSKLCILFQIVVEILVIDVMCVLVEIYSCIDLKSCITKDVLGLFSMFFNVVNFGAPLAGIAHVIKHKCCDTLPLPLCTANLLVSSQWCAFGVLKNDIYIIIPNAAGIVLALIQMSLFLIYPRVAGKPSPISCCFGSIKTKDLEKNDGSQSKKKNQDGSDETDDDSKLLSTRDVSSLGTSSSIRI